MSRKDLLNWANDNEFSIDGIKFLSTVDPTIYYTRLSRESDFLLIKSREMIECELDAVQNLQIANVVDLGIWQGGSVVLLDLVLTPRKLIALDFADRDLPPLDSYIASRGKENIIRVYKSVNQADNLRLRQIVQSEFNGEPIDLVIDDASHFYQETKASFDVLFPQLRKGGKFIIEDWQWSTNKSTAELDYFKGKPSLSNLVLQCILLCATRPDIISSVSVHPDMAIVTRGGASDLTDFSVADFATNRGSPIPILL